MRDVLRKPVVRYLIIFAVLAGGLWFLRDTPREVGVVVDLDRAHRLEQRVLRRLEVRVEDGDKAWISTSTFEFPPALYPDGPGPVRTDPVKLKLKPGRYVARLSMFYRLAVDGPETRFDKEHILQVEERDQVFHLRP